jgi:hypothetical protein
VDADEALRQGKDHVSSEEDDQANNQHSTAIDAVGQYARRVSCQRIYHVHQDERGRDQGDRQAYRLRLQQQEGLTETCGEAELFWVRVIAAFGFYAVLQQWTLANQTGRGDDITAALDKFVAASPIVVAAVIEAYWLGAEGSAALSWRHHAVAALWSAFAITDFFATDITNQRLRARQFNVGDGAG